MAARVVTNVWLSEWSNDFSANYTTWTQAEVDQQRNVRLGVFGALGCGQGDHGVYGALGYGQGVCVWWGRDCDKVRCPSSVYGSLGGVGYDMSVGCYEALECKQDEMSVFNVWGTDMWTR